MVICFICRKEISLKNNLIRHLRNQHGIQKDPYVCALCNKEYRNKKQLQMHTKTHLKVKTFRSRLICVYNCKERFANYKLYRAHLINEHAIPIVTMKETFDSFNDFLTWKDWFEKENKVTFIKGGSHSSGTTYYTCNRSYAGRPSRTNDKLKKRAPKLISTVKVNYTCPATIVLRNINYQYEAECCVTHLHDCSARLQRLTKYDRKQIADKLLRGLSVQRIYEEARNSASGPADRIYLIKKKDIYNVRQALRNSLVKCGSDCENFRDDSSLEETSSATKSAWEENNFSEKMRSLAEWYDGTNIPQDVVAKINQLADQLIDLKNSLENDNSNEVVEEEPCSDEICTESRHLDKETDDVNVATKRKYDETLFSYHNYFKKNW